MTKTQLRGKTALQTIMVVGALSLITGMNAVAEEKYSGDVQISKPLHLTVSSGPLAKVLQQVSKEAGFQLSGNAAHLQGVVAEALTGYYTAKEAVNKLLTSAKIEYRWYEGSLIITGRKAAYKHIGFTTDAEYQAELGAYEDDEAADDVDAFELDEIVVTATKRATNLQDTAISIAAIGAEEIDRRGIVNMEDYLKYTPGVSQLDEGAWRNQVIIRGLATSGGGAGEALVGVYYGETPVTSIAGAGAIDLKTVDIDRVEILRGPQGSLYGAASMGGTIRNIPNAPNLSEFEGKIESGYSNTARFGGDNTMFQGVVNVPLIEDKLAMRAVLYRFDNSGFVKNIAGSDSANLAAANAQGIGELAVDETVGGGTYTGGRLSILWHPTDKLSIAATYTKQDLESLYENREVADLGAYKTAILRPGSVLRGERNANETKTEIFNVVINYDFDWASLHSSTSYVDYQGRYDRTLSFIGEFLSVGSKFPRKSFVEELRLTSQHEGPLQYFAGFYYEESESSTSQVIYNMALDRSSSIHGGGAEQIQDVFLVYEIDQISFFGEVSYELSDQFKITGGMRWFSFDRTDSTAITQAFFSPVFTTEESAISSSESGQSYKLNLSYTPNEDMLFYAQWAQGFRLGKPKGDDTLARAACDTDGDGILDGTNVPFGEAGRLDSDRVNSYEIGAKLSLFDNHMSLNFAAYQTDWSDIPITVSCSVAIVDVSGGLARTRGFEVESNFYVTEGLLINIGGSYVDGQLRSDTNIGKIGDRLPAAPDTQFNIGVQYEFDIMGRSAFIRGDYNYVGDFFVRPGKAGGETKAYGKFDARVGIALSEEIDFDVYAHNITNEDAHTFKAGVTGFRLKPRTIGMNLRYNF